MAQNWAALRRAPYSGGKIAWQTLACPPCRPSATCVTPKSAGTLISE